MIEAILKRLGRSARVGALSFAVCAVPGAALADGIIMVQLAAVKSESRAVEEWTRLKSRNDQLLGDMNLILQRVELGERGVFFRMQTGPFPNRTTAQDMCRQLKAADMDCIVAVR